MTGRQAPLRGAAAPAVPAFVAEVPRALEGERLDRAVSLLTGVARAEAARLVAAGRVRLGELAAPSGASRLRAGERIEVLLDSSPGAGGAGLPPAEPGVRFEVLYEDESIVVVDKPAGLVVHPGAGNREGTLVAGLLSRYPELADLPAAGAGEPSRPGIVHRLDKGTSGVMVVARSPDAYRRLGAQLAARAVRRTYAAVVLGVMEARAGVVDAPIGRSAGDPTRMAVSGSGRRALTRYRSVRSFTRPFAASQLELELETGRTHQIRVHLAAIGHPVLGDHRYGAPRGSLGVVRPMLHARLLSFEHPLTGRPLGFEAPLPADLRSLIEELS